jgi:hypothetical protein
MLFSKIVCNLPILKQISILQQQKYITTTVKTFTFLGRAVNEYLHIIGQSMTYVMTFFKEFPQNIELLIREIS